MKRIFVVDRALIFVFVLSACSGVELHICGHVSSHEIWHDRAVFHVLTSISFFVSAVLHIAAHKGWYKAVIRNGVGRKSRMTVALSLLFLSVSVTGFVLLGVDGAGSRAVLWHYGMGMVMGALSVGHIVRRLHVLLR